MFRLLATESLWCILQTRSPLLVFVLYPVIVFVVDDVNQKIGFHGNVPPSCIQRPLTKAALTLFQPTRCQIFLISRQSWYCLNALHTQNSELEIG